MKNLTQISRRALFVAPLAFAKWFVEGVVLCFQTIRFTDWCCVVAAGLLHPSLAGMLYTCFFCFRLVDDRLGR